MDLDLDALELRAKAATPGPWHATSCCDCWVQAGEIGLAQAGDMGWLNADGVVNSQQEMEANARHIAGLDPQTVLALVARAREVDRLGEERDQAKLNCGRVREQVAAVCVTWSKNGEVKLRAGEMKASEMRAVRACLDGMAREVLAAICTLRPTAAEAETARLRAVVEKLRAALGAARNQVVGFMIECKYGPDVSTSNVAHIDRLLAGTAPDVPADQDGRAG